MIRNFLFHRVNPVRDRMWDPMKVSLFEKCLKYIDKKFEIVRIEDLIGSNQLHTKDKFATIMFDDGYKDNIQYAADILDKYKIKASFYVITESIEKNTLAWSHFLAHSFQSTNISDLELNFDFLPPYLAVTNLPDKEARIRYYFKLMAQLRRISHENRALVLQKIFSTFNDVDMPRIMMNWEDLIQLKNAGHCIGSHTVTHAMLGTMSDRTEIRNELAFSGQTIHEKLGHFPETIAYPIGSFNEVTKELSRDAGYKIGLAVNQNVFEPKNEDEFEISRIELYQEPWWKTRLRITNTLEIIKGAIGYR